MEKETWTTINKIVDEALNRDKKSRENYIREQCGEDESLLKEVTILLESIEESETEQFLETPADFMANLAGEISRENAEPADSVLVGETIGKYEITELIEHGGMGSVFIAKRTDEAYQKKVALKLLRRGMDTPSNIARFKRERNILASLDHRNITRLLDGGVTKEGLPYLVMEYVDGTPLFEYCNRNRLSIRERLRIFKAVCRAVQHAHKNAVIHRDLKPSNILITDEGRVKVLDFGIAKLLEEDTSVGGHFQTRTNARFLTLRYSAPEQVEGRPVTTSTDTYTLGILLYELLAGVHPISAGNHSFLELESLVREKQPEKPSVKFTRQTRDEQKKIAQERGSTPAALRKDLEDELDAIILKALRKEPELRYLSVDQFLDDLERREKDQPVSAKEYTFRYEASKFFKRRKTELGVAAVLLVVLTGSIMFHSWKVAQERDIAQTQARKADQISSFLLELFDTDSDGDTLSVASLLQKGMEHTRDLQSPEAQAVMLSVMGQAYMNFGDYEQAHDLLQQSVRESRQLHGEKSVEYASALYRLGSLQSSRYSWEKAEQSLRQSYQVYSGTLGERHVKTIYALSNLAVALRNLGELEAAEEKSRKAVEITRQLYEPSHSNVIELEANLAYVLREREKMEEAATIYNRVIDYAENNSAIGQGQLAIYHNDLGYLYRKQQDYRRATEQYEQALHLLEESYVSGQPRITNTRRNLATAHYLLGELDATEDYLLRNVSAIREKYSSRHWRTASALNSAGLFYLENQQFGKAESYLRESSQLNREVLGEDHLWTAYSEGLLAASLNLQEKNRPEADSLFNHHYQLFEENRADFDQNNLTHLRILRDVYEMNPGGEHEVSAYDELME